MKRRTGLEIDFAILEALNEGHRKPTRVMYASNLSWGSLMGRLGPLVARGFVIAVEAPYQDNRSTVQYELTEQGKKFIDYFKDFICLVVD